MSDDYDYSECDRLFEPWLRTVCFQQPTPEAYDLARDAFRACYRLLRPENVDYAFKELEQHLRSAGYLYRNGQNNTLAILLDEAADASRQQAERIAELKDDLSKCTIMLSETAQELLDTRAKLSAAQQRLERWEGRETIGWAFAPAIPNKTMNGFTWGKRRPDERASWVPLIARLPDDEGDQI